MPTYQYAKSTDPAVLAAVKRNLAGRRIMHRQACAFSQAHGVNDGGYYDGSFGKTHRPSAIASAERPTTGRWRMGPRRNGFVPAKGNPLAEEFDAIRFEDEDVPGMPVMLTGPGRGGFGLTLYTLMPFLWEGAAWVGCAGMPYGQGVDGENREGFGPQWVEVKGSEWHAAHEGATATEKTVEEEDAP